MGYDIYCQEQTQLKKRWGEFHPRLFIHLFSGEHQAEEKILKLSWRQLCYHLFSDYYLIYNEITKYNLFIFVTGVSQYTHSMSDL